MHLRVVGRVQGVFYRASTLERAEALGLAGWVRNRKDGTVELVAEGPPEALDALHAWCRRGPQWAEVAAVERNDSDPVGLAPGFVVRPTS